MILGVMVLIDDELLAEAGVTRGMYDGVMGFCGDHQGPFTAGIGFRCGVVDESLPTRGITHLLEHLALHGLHTRTLNINGQVDGTSTWFFAQGSEPDVIEFLSVLTTRLTNLPDDRTERERAVLDIESEQSNPYDHIVRARYGPHGYGLTGYSQLGLANLTIEDLRAYAAKYFTRDNSAMYFSREPTSAVRLSLPSGTPINPPDPRRDLLGEGPSFTTGFDDALVFHSPVERSTAQSLIAYVLDCRLRDRLRFDEAIAYSPTCTYRATAPGAAVTFGSVDSDAERIDVATRTALSIIHELTAWTAPITQGEIADYRTSVAMANDQLKNSPSAPAFFADRQIQGLDVPRDFIDEIDLVSDTALQLAASAFADKLVVSVPESLAARMDGWKKIEPGLNGGFAGTAYIARGAARNETLVISPEAVGVHEDHATFYSINNIAAVVCYSNGSRVLVGSDSATVTVVPSAWYRSAELVAQIDEYFSDQLVLRGGDGPTFTPPATSNVKGITFLVLIAVALVALVIASPLYGIAAAGIGGWLAYQRWGLPAIRHYRSGKPTNRFVGVTTEILRTIPDESKR